VNAPVFTGIPFPPGALRDVTQLSMVSAGFAVPRQVKALSYYPDKSLRVVLLGFRVTLAAGQALSAEVRYGAGAGTSLTPAMPWVRNTNVLALCPARWYGDSGVFNLAFLPSAANTIFPAFETRMREKFAAHCDPPSTLDPDFRGYYDHIHALYMTLLRSGGPYSVVSRIWDEIRRYRDVEILPSGGYAGQYRAGTRLTNSSPLLLDTIRRE
jgi:hypothetical protein